MGVTPISLRITPLLASPTTNAENLRCSIFVGLKDSATTTTFGPWSVGSFGVLLETNLAWEALIQALTNMMPVSRRFLFILTYSCSTISSVWEPKYSIYCG